MEEELSDLIKTREIIKKKFNAFRQGEADTSFQLEKHFKPVTEPLKAILKAQSEEPPDDAPVKEEEEEADVKEEHDAEVPAGFDHGTRRGELYDVLEKNYGPKVSAYLYDKLTSTVITRKNFDETYGLRRDQDANSWAIGNRQVSFDSEGRLIIDGAKYDPEPGFLELLFKRDPRGYTQQDLDRYREVLKLTSGHKRSYDESKPVNSNKSSKYRDVISVLFPAKQRSVKKNKSAPIDPMTGSGVTVPQAPKSSEQVFVSHDTKSERVFVYWDDPNELVKRLALLIASRDAGHTGHDREILSIAEELRESGFIE